MMLKVTIRKNRERLNSQDTNPGEDEKGTNSSENPESLGQLLPY